MDEALLSISSPNRCQLVKMLIIIEKHGMFGSNLASILDIYSTKIKYGTEMKSHAQTVSLSLQG